MKRMKFLLAALLCSMAISGIAQQAADTTRWWLPSAFGTCRTLTTDFTSIDDWVYYATLPNGDTIADCGQFYDCYSETRLAGVVMLYGTHSIFSFRLRDVISDTIIVESLNSEPDSVMRVTDPMTGNFRDYAEYYFDSVITVNGQFFISRYYPSSNYNSGMGVYQGIPIYYKVLDPATNTYVACNSGKTAMMHYTDGRYVPILEHLISAGVSSSEFEGLGINRSFLCDVGIFPIFAEEDEPNGGSGETGGGESDSTSGLPSVEVEKYMSVFPNPASERLNVGCSYKIQSYAILNSLGQELISEKANANTLNINLAGLKSGVYFIKIHTSKGTATKRFVVR